jgi:hypothetical protein
VADSARVVAVYDGIKCPLTYDFIVFASMAKTYANGKPLHFVFLPSPDGSRSKPGKFHPDEEDWRFRHIILEAVHLFDSTMEVRDSRTGILEGNLFPVGYTPEKPVFNYQVNGVVDMARPMLGPKPSVKAVRYVQDYLQGRDPITVTLRQTRYPDRNSSLDAWFKFAKDKDVVLIPDTDAAFTKWPCDVFTQAAVNMDIRLALYSQAKLNCFTSNGPSALCWFNDYPYLLFKAGGEPYITKEQWDDLKVPYGTQPSFIRPNQKWVWEADSIDVIRREVEDLHRLG